jgi:hypothetical protein
MAPKRRWWVPALVLLILVAIIGSWGCCTVTCCERKPRNQLVLVVDGDKPSIDPIVISKKAEHEIVWKLPAESTIANVTITLGRNPAPFVGCQTSEGVCRIACQDRLCISGPINAALVVPESGRLYYEYAFTRPVTGASADPGIEIRP